MKKILLLFILISAALNAAETVSNKEKLTKYLADLIAINSVTLYYEGNLTALKYVETDLNGLNLYCKYHKYGDHHSLVITTQDTKTPSVWLVSHIDVVPAPEKLFKAKVENGKMFGRGAYDMKMAIACYLLLMHDLKDQLSEYNIGIMLTSDEEIGGMNGTTRLLNEGYTSKVALLPDGGFNWNFEEAAKGVMQIKVSSYGKSAHGSRPWEGENAINHLMALLTEINKYFNDKKDNQSYYSTVNVGFIQGGKGINQVPDYAEAKLDIRFPADEKAEEIFSDLQNIGKNYPKTSMEKMIQASPNSVDVNQHFFQSFKAIASEMYGIDIGTVRSHGASDARFFGEKNIPVLVITCKGGEIHSDDEWVDLDDLSRFYEVVKLWITENFRK